MLRAQRHEFANRLNLLNGLLHAGNTDEATRYAELAKKCWAKADPNQLEAELTALRQLCGLHEKVVNQGDR